MTSLAGPTTAAPSTVSLTSSERQRAGEYDGDEFGGGQRTVYPYGPDADRLFMRCGGREDPAVREEVVPFP